MPVIYVRPQYNSQNGYASSQTDPYIAPSYNYGLVDTRVGFVRFAHVAVPKGATINSAKIHLSMSVKTPANPYSVTIVPWVDLRHDSPWLDQTRAEWGGRTWYKPAATINSNFVWSNPAVTPQRHIQAVDVKAHVQDLNALAGWTAAGGPMTFLFGFASVSNPDYIYIHTLGDSFPPLLEIDYTPPVSDGKDTVVNIQENANFTRTANSNAAFSIEPFGFSDWFGSFGQPTYAVNAAGGPAAPFGGNVLKVTSGSTRAMVHNGVAALEEGWWNYSAYVYVPAGSSDVSITALGVKNQGGDSATTVKGQWARINHAVIADGSGVWFTIQQHDSIAGSVFYVADVQLTEGRLVRPPINGYRTLTNATYGWAGGTGQNGFVRAVPPQTPTVTPILPKARRKYWAPAWSYANSAGHAQVLAEIKTGRVK